MFYNRLLISVIGIAGVIVVWYVATDVIYCAAAFRTDMIAWPFNAWTNDWPARNYSPIVTLRYWGSALIPAICLARALGFGYHRFWPRFAGLYGNSRIATWREMRRAGIRHTRHPLP